MWLYIFYAYNSYVDQLTVLVLILNKNTYRVQKGKANQKQQLSDYTYIAKYTGDQKL